MAHWAQLDSDNKVTQVVVTENNEDEGYGFLMWAYGGKWVKTSYNTLGGKHLLGGTPLRKNYAGIGFTYDEERDAFIPPKPFESWFLDEETCLWQPRVPYPTDDKNYDWDEETLSWVEVELPTEE